MKTKPVSIFRALTLVIVTASLILEGQAKAALVYDSGTFLGNIYQFISGAGNAVSTLFTVSSPVYLSSVTAALNGGGGMPTSVNWLFGTSPLGSDIGSGIASLNDTSTSYPNVYESSFAVNSPMLADGTYWITLQNATSSNGGSVFWEADNGPGSPEYGTSFSFQLYGSATAVPEPATYGSIVGAGALAVSLWTTIRRKSSSIA